MGPSGVALGVGLLLLGALAVGGAVGTLLSPTAAPASVATAAPLASAEVTPLAYRDPREASFALTAAPPQSLRSGRTGVLTTFACHEGGGVASGAGLFSIDGEVVVGLSTSIPLWRNIDFGDEGPDVAALQSELVRLGKGLTIDGYWGRPDATAFREVMTAAGASPPESVDLGAVAWLPAASVATSACLVGPGSTVAAGEALAEFPRPLTSARLERTPADAVAGERVIVAGGREYPVPDGGVITDPATLAGILESSEYQQARAESGTATVGFDYLLAEPLEVTSIPPSALYSLEGALACVQESGVAVRVEIVASQLGQSLVVAEHPIGSVDLRPDPRVGCG